LLAGVVHADRRKIYGGQFETRIKQPKFPQQPAMAAAEIRNGHTRSEMGLHKPGAPPVIFSRHGQVRRQLVIPLRDGFFRREFGRSIHRSTTWETNGDAPVNIG
jgi:hypothetical protein